VACRHELIPQCLDEVFSIASVFEFLNVLADIENDLCRAGEHFHLLSRSGVKRHYFFIVVQDTHGYLLLGSPR
jgi:hypothetical protein